VFCQNDLGRLGVEALLCSHAFHTSCIDDYISATGRTRLNCCPFKCGAVSEFATGEVVVVPSEPEAEAPAVVDLEGERLAEIATTAAAGIA
jgi:hypothetical protein